MKFLWPAALLLSSQVALAIPNNTMDLLSLPGENRRAAVQGISSSEFDRLSEVAFSEKQSMRLRWAALVSIADANSQKALPLLIKASNDKQWFMRNAALVALAATQPLKAEAVAKNLLQDKALVVRSAAVDVLQKYQSPQNRDLLWSELERDYNYRNNESLWIRPQIVSLLAQKPADHEKTLFARLLKDSDSRIHLSSIRGLEKLTGVRLGNEKTSKDKMLVLWKDYVKKEVSF